MTNESFSVATAMSRHDDLMNVRLREEQRGVSKETIAISRGAFIGAAVLTAAAVAQGAYEAGIASVEGSI